MSNHNIQYTCANHGIQYTCARLVIDKKKLWVGVEF
jgi:hypothetical protein